jgi:membrane-bound metal-dependent hydrolase YbcI (DUF457 family)
VFIGHYAVGFALKRAAPFISLGWLLAAPQLPDMLWPIFLLLGWEHVAIDPGNTRVTPLSFVSYPWSHSLVLVVAWGMVLGAVYLSRTRRAGASALLALAVVSHWLLDWVTHGPDLPIVPWSAEKVGLGLWNSVPATLAIEVLMYVAGVWLYVRSTRRRGREGRAGFVALVAFLVLVYIGNVFGPAPPDARSVAILTLGLWLIPLWGAWVDTHRVTAAA